MDNRQFNVNGSGKEFLSATIQLAFTQSGWKSVKCYAIDEKKGMILFWTDVEKAIPLPGEFNAEAIANFVWCWLESKPVVECIGWDENADHDGENSIGWRVYCEEWGHVASRWEAIVAVKPAYLWHGK